MVLEFYYDLLSQPSRAVYIFLKATGIPFESKEIDLFKGEHHSPEFLKKNPYHKVPVIVEDDFTLAESVAIMRYLAVRNDVADHWYPRADQRKQAKIEEFLHWQHLCVRKPCIDLFITKFRSRIAVGRFTKEPIDEAKVKTLREEISKTVAHIADYFLKDNTYIGGNEVSVADILGVCEIYHLIGVEEESLFENNAKVGAWIERVLDRLQPHSVTANTKLMGIKAMYINAKE